MDISNIGGSLAAQTSDAVGLTVLKNAIRIQEQAAIELLEAIPDPSAANNPSHLGQTIDVRA
ncbi:MAG: YjfB family protein [Betaproteobacteria bacterium]|nr:YjfB family protein [Betaproteobacteria bacterium]